MDPRRLLAHLCAHEDVRHGAVCAKESTPKQTHDHPPAKCCCSQYSSALLVFDSSYTIKRSASLCSCTFE